MKQVNKFEFVVEKKNDKEFMNLTISSLKDIGFEYDTNLCYFDLKADDLVKGTFEQAKESILSNRGGAIWFIKKGRKLGSFGFIGLRVYFGFGDNTIIVTFDDTYTKYPNINKNKKFINEVVSHLKSDLKPKKVIGQHVS